MIVKFKISKERKGNATNNFNPELSKYWKQKYYSMFERW